jgi:hypothetical protein
LETKEPPESANSPSDDGPEPELYPDPIPERREQAVLTVLFSILRLLSFEDLAFAEAEPIPEPN